jgi:hypothetical protein
MKNIYKFIYYLKNEYNLIFIEGDRKTTKISLNLLLKTNVNRILNQ